MTFLLIHKRYKENGKKIIKERVAEQECEELAARTKKL